MIDKAQHLAQSLSNGLSRRNFLGGVGRSAALIALACGGLLSLPEGAHAGRPCIVNGVKRPCPHGQVCGDDGRCHRDAKQDPPKEPPPKK